MVHSFIAQLVIYHFLNPKVSTKFPPDITEAKALMRLGLSAGKTPAPKAGKWLL